jgi:CHAT domain-containing protein/Tfp pilus assembly protein PilF
MQRKTNVMRAIVFVLCISLTACAGYKASISNNSTIELNSQGRFQEALESARNAVTSAETELEPNNPELATYLDNYAALLIKLGQYNKAEPVLERAKKIRQISLGASHPSFAVSLSSLANLYQSKGEYEKAGLFFEQALSILEKAGQGYETGVAITLNNLADNQTKRGRYVNAEALYEKAIMIFKEQSPPDYKMMGLVYNNLAQLFRSQGKYEKAADYINQALDVQKNIWGKEHPEIAITLNNQAEIYVIQGKYEEAESVFRKAIGILESAYGQDHPQAAILLSNYAGLYRKQRRYERAMQLLNRALEIQEKNLGVNHPAIAVTLNNLATLYYYGELYEQGERLVRRALSIQEANLGLKNPAVAKTLSSLGEMLRAQKRIKEAESCFLHAMEIIKNNFGPNHPDIIAIYNSLAVLYADERRYAEAEGLYKDSIVSIEKYLGKSHPDLAALHHGLAKLYVKQDMFKEGLAEIKIATSMQGVLARQTEYAQESNFRSYYEMHIATLAAISEKSVNNREKAHYIEEAFEKSEEAISTGAAKALSRMATRLSTGDEKLADIIRKRQDAIERWQVIESRLILSLSDRGTRRDADIEADLRTTLASLQKEIKDTDSFIHHKYPQYAELSNPPPLSISLVQGILKAGEALLEYVVTERDSYLFVVTKEDFDFIRLGITRSELNKIVHHLRSGLDFNRMDSDNVPPPFDVVTSYNLFQKIFAPAMHLLKDIRHVFIVPDGALLSLPPGVLVMDNPPATIQKTVNYSETSWLAKRYSTTILPSAGALRALRIFANPSKAVYAFIGFGDPALKGAKGKSRSISIKEVSPNSKESEPYKEDVAIYPFGADVEIPELPETASELRMIARALGAGEDSIYLRERATKTLLQKMDLKAYRTIAFSTHGLMSGEIKGLSEPAIVLSPQKLGNTFDNGLLSATDIANLKLDADWVVLSACNTAASSGKAGADGLSGLARAFFYAGSRTLLVSHWAVNSNATVRLITGMFERYASSPQIGRAEALRQSMLALMEDKKAPQFAHPLYWAPFIVVGEGGR